MPMTNCANPDCGKAIKIRANTRIGESMCQPCRRATQRKPDGYKSRRKNHQVGGTGYNKHRPILRAQWEREGIPCWICGGQEGPIDYGAGPYDPHSFSVHHIRDRYEGGDRDDPANMVGAHLRCNQVAGGNAIKARRHHALVPSSVDHTPHTHTHPHGVDHVSDRWRDE